MSEKVIPTHIAAHLLESKINWERAVDAVAVLTHALGEVIAALHRAGVADADAVLANVRRRLDGEASPMANGVVSQLEQQTRGSLRR